MAERHRVRPLSMTAMIVCLLVCLGALAVFALAVPEIVETLRQDGLGGVVGRQRRTPVWLAVPGFVLGAIVVVQGMVWVVREYVRGRRARAASLEAVRRRAHPRSRASRAAADRP